MFKTTLKSVLQYTGVIVVTAILFWLSLRGLIVGKEENWGSYLWNMWQKADAGYLWITAIISVISHALRAERWRMLLAPTGNQAGFIESFISLMIGYLVNLVIPRGGEFSRCYNLYKLKKIPVEISFGTVVAERIVDVICLFILVAGSFIVEWSKLKKFIHSLPLLSNAKSAISPWVLIIILIGLSFILAIYLLKKNKTFLKIVHGFKEGAMAIFEMKNKFLFIAYTLGIWIFYFVMTYFVVKAFPETEILGWDAVLTLFAIGSIAMTVPLPGGIGSYHTLVPLGLVMLYGIAKENAIAFVFVFHGWQTSILILLGGISVLTSYWMMKWRKPQKK